MARITPKTNWIDNDIPTAVDLNRIENNSSQAFNELDTEVAARIAADNAEATARSNADTTLQNNINSEANARIAADNAEATTRAGADAILQNNINAEATTRANADTALQNSIIAEITAEVNQRTYQDQKGFYTAPSGGITYTLPSGGTFMYIIFGPPGAYQILSISTRAGGSGISLGAFSNLMFWRIS